MHAFFRDLIRILCLMLLALPAKGRGEEGIMHLIPDVAMLPQGGIDGGQSSFFTGNRTEGTFGRGEVDARLGLSDFADIDLGYAGGFTLGLTASVLHERSWYLPSIAVGFSNVFNNSDNFLFKYDSAAWKSDAFIALGKNVPLLGIRLCGGFEAMPEVPQAQATPFFGIEKSIGNHATLSLETRRIDRALQPSLFANAWLFGDRAELSLGAVDMNAMVMNGAGTLNVSFFSPARGGTVQPGVWVGLRFHGVAQKRPAAPSPALLGARCNEQGKRIAALERVSDSLRRGLAQSGRMIDSLRGSITLARYKNGILENLTMLAALYSQPNFDVSQVWIIKKEITDLGDLAVPDLQAIALDKSCDASVHAQAVGLLGDIGSQNAADAVFEVLSTTHDPETVIEGCIAAGKMHDRRAETLLEKFAGDRNESVAFTAASTLKQLK
jgi:hypothetical protein